MMVKKAFIINMMSALMAAMLFCACSESLSEPDGMPGPAYAEVTIEDFIDGNAVFSTRYSSDNSDKWTVNYFTKGDQVGMYALKGREDGANGGYNLPVVNGILYCESGTPSSYRFSNPSIVLDPNTIKSNNSLLYFPYYSSMPETTDDTDPPGMWLRKEDEMGIERCLDFMTTKGNMITVSSGVMSPTFEHKFSILYIQRGEGFDQPEDDKVFVVMKDPVTDVRIAQTSATSVYSMKLQYNPPEAAGDVKTNLEGRLPFEVDKYSVWECWKAGPYAGDYEMNYAVIPPGDVYLILMQDNNGNWQTVTDFYMQSAGKKDIVGGSRYLVRVSKRGVDVVARPVSIDPWDDEMEITDSRDEGINDAQEYYEFVSHYNTYIESGRSKEYEESLMPYGKGSYNLQTGRTSWTFYINGDISFRGGEFPQIKVLDDEIEGSSTYTNYSFRNIETTLIGEMTSNGALRMLDFNDIYMVRTGSNDQPFSPMIGTLNGGTIEECNIINAIVISENPIGLIAGSTTGATIKDCVFSGDMIGISTAEGYSGLFGTASGTVTLSNVKMTGLQFIEN